MAQDGGLTRSQRCNVRALARLRYAELVIAGSEWVRPQNECGEGAYADVIINNGGDVNQIVCLPVEG